MNNNYVGLFLDMGMGKTVISLSAIVDLILIGEVKRVLIVAPLRVAKSVWGQETKKWIHTSWLRTSLVVGNEKQRKKALSDFAEIYVTTTDNVHWICEYFDYKMPFDLLVIDELSKFKSHDSRRFKALKQARNSFKRIWGLTGTPTGNKSTGYMGLWSQMYILDGGQRLLPYISHYRNKYFVPKRVGASEAAVKYDLMYGAEEKINAKIADICLALRSEDYLDLPPFIVEDVEVPLPPDVMALYDKFAKDKIIELDLLDKPITSDNMAALTGKLLEFSNGAVYYKTIEGEREVRHWQLIHDYKLNALMTIVEEADGAPMLLAYQFQHDLERIKVALKHNFPELVVKVLDDKQETVDSWNNKEINVLISHCQSAGHGLNLQDGGNFMVWFGLPWSYEFYKQFNKRLHRGEIKLPVKCLRLICPNTYEEVVRSTQDDSAEMARKFLDFIIKYRDK